MSGNSGIAQIGTEPSTLQSINPSPNFSGDFRIAQGNAFDFSTPVFGQDRDNNILLQENSPSAIATDLKIPEGTSALTFDFRFTNLGDGDWMTITFNNLLLFSCAGQHFSGAEFQHIEIPIEGIAGQTGVLTVKLNSVGAANAELIVSNFQFLSSGDSPPALPDLVVSSLGNPPASVVAGGTFPMASTTTNQGTGLAGPSGTRHYLSLDSTITSSDLAVPGTYGLGDLAAGDSVSETTTITVPINVSPGIYFFGACADDFLEVDESDEANNCRVATTLVVNPACTYSLLPASQSFLASEGPGNVSVTASSGCPWTAVSNDPSWITITSSSPGNGSDTVGYIVAANPGPNPRRGTLTIAGKTFIVSQGSPLPPPCTITFDPPFNNVASGGGLGIIDIAASNSTCSWTAKSFASWITITAGASSKGDGLVQYNVAANPGPGPRAGRILINGKSFKVTQTP